MNRNSAQTVQKAQAPLTQLFQMLTSAQWGEVAAVNGKFPSSSQTSPKCAERLQVPTAGATAALSQWHPGSFLSHGVGVFCLSRHQDQETLRVEGALCKSGQMENVGFTNAHSLCLCYSLDQLHVSPGDQERVQAVLSSVGSKSTVLSLLQEVEAHSQVSGML